MPSARSKKDSKGGTSQPGESASRTIMLKSAATWIASTRASSETPAARAASASVGPSSCGRSVSFSTKPSAARSRSSIGAVRQSRLTASQTSSPSAYAATAPWAFVQKGHWLSDETKRLGTALAERALEARLLAERLEARTARRTLRGKRAGLAAGDAREADR